MEAITLEIRDACTFIPALAVRFAPTCNRDRYLLDRAGFGSKSREQARFIMLAKIDGGVSMATCDPYEWSSRTMVVAHKYIIENWGTIDHGAVIDVEFILGISNKPKVSEAEE